MKTYKVVIHNTYETIIYVDADSKEEALPLAMERSEEEQLEQWNEIDNKVFVNEEEETSESKEYDITLERSYVTCVSVKATSKEEAIKLGYELALERESEQNDVIETLSVDNEIVELN